MIQTTKSYKHKDKILSLSQEITVSKLARTENLSYLDAKEKYFNSTLLKY